ncbi:MAG: alpha/beta hydrolase [Sandaracinaceae bacterium]|nr:alpha/beta hydrolase [Sandaracinaceae bacterium]
MSEEARGARRLRSTLVALAGILALVLGVVWLQRSMLFPRRFTMEDPRARATPGLEVRWIESDQGPVELWFLPGDGVTRDAPGPAVVFTHGNGELIDHWPAALAPYRRLGLSVVLPEYRGYGRSAGDPSEARIAADLAAAHALVVRDPRVDAARLVYHGRSLGGGAVGTLLDAHPPRALILESTFTSVTDVARGMGVPGFVIADPFPLLERLGRYDGPVLVMHGTRDEVIPTAHGRRLAASHPRAELVLYDCGHNDLPPPESDYWPRIERFLRASGVLPRE